MRQDRSSSSSYPLFMRVKASGCVTPLPLLEIHGLACLAPGEGAEGEKLDSPRQEKVCLLHNAWWEEKATAFDSLNLATAKTPLFKVSRRGRGAFYGHFASAANAKARIKSLSSQTSLLSIP